MAAAAIAKTKRNHREIIDTIPMASYRISVLNLYHTPDQGQAMQASVRAETGSKLGALRHIKTITGNLLVALTQINAVMGV
jgi:hypothetical protein